NRPCLWTSKQLRDGVGPQPWKPESWIPGGFQRLSAMTRCYGPRESAHRAGHKSPDTEGGSASPCLVSLDRHVQHRTRRLKMKIPGAGHRALREHVRPQVRLCGKQLAREDDRTAHCVPL